MKYSNKTTTPSLRANAVSVAIHTQEKEIDCHESANADSRNDDFPNLPRSWQVKTLGEVCDILDNMRKPINATEREQRLKNSTHKYAYYGATGQVGYIDDFLCDFESILLGEDGAPFLEPFKDKAYIVSGKYWVNNHAHILRAKKNLTINKFLCHFLNIVDYMPYVSGTTRLKLNQSAMKQIKIPIPPLEIQKRIVQRLDEAFSRIENGTKHLQSAKDNIAKYKQSLLKSAFKGTLTQDCHELPRDSLNDESSNLPQGWTIKTLGECLDYEQPTKYIVKSTKYNDSYKIPVLTAGKSFILGYTNELDGIFTQTPVIIFDDFTTDTKFVDFHFKVKSSAMKILHPKENIDIKFVYYLMQTIQYRSDMHKRYWISQYAKIKIPIPPLETQKQIVAILEKHFTSADKVGAYIDSCLTKAKQLKSSLLKSAFEGKL